MEKLIEFKNLTVKLKDRILYENLSLIICEGDRFVFLGPNGVGKSLLLELIALGYSKELCDRYKGLSVSGMILDGKGNDLLNPVTDRNISYAAQAEDFYKNTTVYDEAETACHGVDMELDEDKLDYLLEKFDILDKKKKRIRNNISFGEGKIIHLITRILKLGNTNLLLLDEPLNHLSFKNSKVFNEVVENEIEENSKLAILMISHCRAVSFAEKAMIYDKDIKGIRVVEYKPYDCFGDDFGNCIC